ncbi:hypothetical protein [Nitrosospira multiformis]|uniref:hypothetical protein n=1 Tax=Nitrosospira multiformis TaxID=1231 RepID=UPI00116037AB|nr:hypothetical protein [Nitrosospira multiformis]
MSEVFLYAIATVPLNAIRMGILPYNLLSHRFQQRISGVGVELDVDLGRHILYPKIPEKSASGNRLSDCPQLLWISLLISYANDE